MTSARVRQLPDGTYVVDPPPRPAPWWVRVGAYNAVRALTLFMLSVSGHPYRTNFPRHPAPSYVCIYYSPAGSATTVQGSQPCPRP